MREKYESLSLAELKEVAKFRGLRGVSAMKKADLVDAMLKLDEELKQKEEEEKKASENTEPERNTQSRPQTGRQAMNRQPGKRVPGRPGGRVSASGSYGNRLAGNHDENKTERRPSGDRTVQTATPDTRTAQSAVDDVRTEQPPVSDGRIEYVAHTQPAAQIQTEEAAASQAEFEQPTFRKSFENGGSELDSGVEARGILEVMPDGFGFIRSDNYMPGDQDVYVSPNQIRRFNLKTGDVLCGNTRVKIDKEKYRALLYVKTVNGYNPDVVAKRPNFEDLTPIFPDERLVMEHPGCSVAMRVMDLLSPVGKGQRGMIVSPPKAGKTTLLKAVAQSLIHNNPDVHLIILLIDERPEEVTDMKEAIQGHNVEVIHSTFDESPEHHKRVAEMTIGRAKRLVEQKQDVCILLDSITRLTRAYNLTVVPSGRTLSGGLDPAALYMPKRFFGAARNMREGGSLTILATALVETGSKMDDVVYEEFKGTGNMEIILDRKLSEKRIFPAIDIPRSSTRREDLLLSKEEQEAVTILRRGLNGMKPEEAVDRILELFSRTRSNDEFVQIVRKQRIF
ncbi:MAG: transcription termination factor Rho [Lachnospiraceae bacterium]|nr:transcription termination factor Rho [Lachnospiraceae bacterium]